MNIEEAISCLHTLAIENTGRSAMDEYDALYLGIEALKRMKDVRHIFSTPYPKLLPGETRD